MISLSDFYKNEKYHDIITKHDFNCLSDNDKFLFCLSLLKLQQFDVAESKLLDLVGRHPNNLAIVNAAILACENTRNLSALSALYRSCSSKNGDTELLVVSRLVEHVVQVQCGELNKYFAELQTLAGWLKTVPLLSSHIGAKQLKFLRNSKLASHDRDRIVYCILLARVKYSAFCSIFSRALMASRKNEDLLPKLIQLMTDADPKSAVNFVFKYMKTHGLQHENFSEDVLNNLSIAFQRMGEYKVAERICELFVETTRDYRKLNNIALVYSANKKPHLAEKIFLRIIDEFNSPFEPVANLANMYRNYTYYKKADKYYKLAIEINPESHHIKLNYSTFLMHQGRIADCVSVLSKIVSSHDASNSMLAAARNNMKFALNYYNDVTDEDLLKFYNDTGTKNSKTEITLARHAGRLKVGLLSGDFKNHSAFMFLEGFFDLERHFEVSIISNVTKKDQETDLIRRRFGGRFLDIAGEDTKTASDSVRSLGLHAIIDLSGPTAGNRLDIFEHRVSQVQASALGFNFTTGSSFVDYLVAQKGFYSAGDEGKIKENLLTMTTPLPIVAREYFVNEKFQRNVRKRVVCCSRAVRINEDVMHSWKKIADATNCIVEVNSSDFRSEEAKQLFFSRYKAFAVEEFMELGYETPIEKVYARADLTLDCFPHNSGTTLYESLLCGVPFITLYDRVSVGRFGGFLASACGHPEWVARSEDEYVEKVVRFLNDDSMPDRLELSRTARAALTNVRSWSDELASHIKRLVVSKERYHGGQ